MKVIEFLRKAQYSRLTVGSRWMTVDSKGWTVCERKRHAKTTTILNQGLTEDEAVELLIEGEELYHYLINNK